jgi:hypothetical protein
MTIVPSDRCTAANGERGTPPDRSIGPVDGQVLLPNA